MSRALIVVSSDYDRERAASFALQAPHGTRIEFKAARRSVDQNSLLWARLTDIATQVVWHGEKLTPEDWKDLFTASLRRMRLVPGIDPGTFVPVGMRTSDMGKAEFSDLLELIAAFGAERGVKFHDDKGEAA
ncbi:Recombination protein NinB [Hyphomicrobium sp. 1Nfss2.1]|uniref:recombination protein NinB n=1 Tax=Hyphomicrobium sp. 1Nfss2.1 TaxID=3413936 RepID=UPI003C7D279C